MIRFFLLFFSFIAVVNANVCTMFPKNDWHIPVNFNANGITEKRFNELLQQARDVYTPIFKARGCTYSLVGDWQSTEVNAYAQRTGNVCKVTILGGIVRAPEQTEEGLMTVIGHENGHHLANFPFYSGSTMSNESQSDNYATAKAIRHLYKGKGSIPVSSEITKLCMETWTADKDLDLCEIGISGGQALANLLASLQGVPAPSLSKEDPTIVSKTKDEHMSAQIRLDQYKRGAQCTVSESIDFGKTDERIGACYDLKYGRARSWFKFKYPPTDNPNPTDPCEEDPESCEPEPTDDIAPDFKIGSVSGLGLMFTFQLSETCPAAKVEVRKGKFTTANDTKLDPKGYLWLTGEEGEDNFIVPSRHFKRKTDNYLRYFCHSGDGKIFGKASNALKYRRK